MRREACSRPASPAEQTRHRHPHILPTQGPHLEVPDSRQEPSYKLLHAGESCHETRDHTAVILLDSAAPRTPSRWAELAASTASACGTQHPLVSGVTRGHSSVGAAKRQGTRAGHNRPNASREVPPYLPRSCPCGCGPCCHGSPRTSGPPRYARSSTCADSQPQSSNPARQQRQDTPYFNKHTEYSNLTRLTSSPGLCSCSLVPRRRKRPCGTWQRFPPAAPKPGSKGTMATLLEFMADITLGDGMRLLRKSGAANDGVTVGPGALRSPPLQGSSHFSGVTFMACMVDSIVVKSLLFAALAMAWSRWVWPSLSCDELEVSPAHTCVSLAQPTSYSLTPRCSAELRASHAADSQPNGWLDCGVFRRDVLPLRGPGCHPHSRACSDSAVCPHSRLPACLQSSRMHLGTSKHCRDPPRCTDPAKHHYQTEAHAHSSAAHAEHRHHSGA